MLLKYLGGLLVASLPLFAFAGDGLNSKAKRIPTNIFSDMKCMDNLAQSQSSMFDEVYAMPVISESEPGKKETYQVLGKFKQEGKTYFAGSKVIFKFDGSKCKTYPFSQTDESVFEKIR